MEDVFFEDTLFGIGCKFVVDGAASKSACTVSGNYSVGVVNCSHQHLSWSWWHWHVAPFGSLTM